MKENQRVTLTKRLLREALLQLLDKKALDKISVTELCNESGINRATFYRHYNIPRDVLLDMELEFTEKLYPIFYESASNDASEHLKELCSYLYDNSELIKVFIRNNSEEDLTLLINNMFRSFIEKKNVLENLHGFDEADLKLITTCIAGGGYFMLRRWLMDDIQKSPQEVSNLILSFINYTSAIFNPQKQSSL